MSRGLTFPSILATIGHTPLVGLTRVIPADHARVLVKCELFNPMHTVKDRVVLALIEGAEADGSLAPGARPEHRGKTIVTVACSPGERYLSTALYGAVA